MFKALKSQKVTLQVLLPFIGLLAYPGLVLSERTDLFVVTNAQGFLYSFYRTLSETHPLILVVGSFTLLVLFSTYLFWFNIRFEILGQRTVLISYLYFFVVAVPLYLGHLHPGFLAAVVLFLGLVSIFNVYGKTRYLANLFNAGLVFGLAVILYPPYLVMLPLFLLAIARMKQPLLRDFITLILGLLAVIWLYSGILLVSGDFAYQWISVKQWFAIRSTWPLPIGGNHILQIIWLSWIIVMVLFSLSASRARKDAGRRVSSVLLQLLWITPLMAIIFERVSVEVWSLMAIPMAKQLTLGLSSIRRPWLYNLFFVILTGFLIAFQWVIIA